MSLFGGLFFETWAHDVLHVGLESLNSSELMLQPPEFWACNLPQDLGFVRFPQG